MQSHKVEQLRGLLKRAAPQGVDVVFDPGGCTPPQRAPAMPRAPSTTQAAAAAAAGGCAAAAAVPRAVGGDFFAEALKAVKWGASICIIGFASGKIPS